MRGTLFGEMLAFESEGRVIVEAMNAMGYDAMTVGLMDLAKGVDVLLQRAREAEFAIVSCNLLDAKTGQLLLEPYVVLERAGVRYGILGVSEPNVIRAPVGDDRPIQVLDPVEAVRRYLPEVQQRSDVVILLSHLGLVEDGSLAEAVPGIDIIVGGRTRQLMTVPGRIGNTVIVQMGYDGEWLGGLEVALAPQGGVEVLSFGRIELGPDVPDDLQLAALVNRYKEQYATPTPNAH